jgi:GT2 family glycosyltransferase
MATNRTNPIGITITFGDIGASAVVGPRLHVTVLDYIPETGIVAAGWLADMPEAIAAITLEQGRGYRLDLLRDATLPLTPDLFDAFDIPREVAASRVFAFFLPGMSGQLEGGLRLEIRHNSGAVEDCFVPATGDFFELGRIIELAPLDQAVSLAERFLVRWEDAPAAALPPVIETWMARLHQRIGRQPGLTGGIDEVVRVGTGGMLLRGRLPAGAAEGAAAITFVSLGGRRVVLEMPLPALAAACSAAPRGIGLDDGSGFAVFAGIPGLRPDERFWFLEVTATDGRIERIPFICATQPPVLRGIEAAFALLEPPPPDPERVMERAVAPAVDSFWLAARRGAPVAKPAIYGDVVGAPQVSVIVPLDDRIDRMRHQIAQFSNDPEFRSATMVELIFVVDNVSVTEELRRLSQSLYDTYGVPFRTVALDHSVGRASAGNMGADAASGSVLLFLGADVLPKRSRWVGHLLRSYRTLDRCGVLGCRLLFEDGSIRHGGVTFRIATSLPGLWEEHDAAAGLPGDFEPARGTVRVPAVTGACLMIDRMLLRQLGGFAEEYLFGGFADYDLCLAAQGYGRYVYYSSEVELYQLPAAAPINETRWQEQLTRYNRWKHSRKWRSLIPTVLAAVEA